MGLGCCGGETFLGMGSALGLGQDGTDGGGDDSTDSGGLPLDSSSGGDDSYNLTSLTDETIGATAPTVSTSGDSGGSSGGGGSSILNPGGSSSSSGMTAAQIDAAIAAALQGGTKIAQIATGQTGSISITSNEIMIGLALLAAVLILPAVIGKK